jgi:NADPH:quinone reductase-like Zn-dependent oxidoreductase
MSETMKAVVIETYGAPEVLQVREVPRPLPAEGEVRIRIHAASINPVDTKVRSGNSLAGQYGARPVVLGWDVSGVVDVVGAGVDRFAVGDEVYGMIRFPEEGKAYAEYATAPAEHLARKPKRLSHVEAAAVPLAALTAWQALFEAGDLQPGQRVLIHAAAGGVGHFAVQLARWKGASVVGTASAPKTEFVRGLGAGEVVDYTAGPFEERVAPVDVVLDSLGGEVQQRSLRVLKPGGILITILGLAVDPKAAEERGVRVGRILVRPSADQLSELAELIDAGEVTPHVAATFPLAAAAEAHRHSETGRTQGKIVLEVAS